jgi:hypothetical protein
MPARIPTLASLRVALALSAVAISLRLFGVAGTRLLLRPIERPGRRRIPHDRRLASSRWLALRVAAVADAMPLKPRCLVRCLTITAALRRRGVDAVLLVGVKISAGFDAHSWVEVDEVPISDTPEHVEGYRRLWAAESNEP